MRGRQPGSVAGGPTREPLLPSAHDAAGDGERDRDVDLDLGREVVVEAQRFFVGGVRTWGRGPTAGATTLLDGFGRDGGAGVPGALGGGAGFVLATR